MQHRKAIRRARQLRSDANRPEQLVWLILRSRRLGGLKFCRQHPIEPYIVDFCCRELKLVVELDGDSHRDKLAYDRQRESFLKQQGYRVVKIVNDDVRDLDAVARLIAREAGIEWNA